MVGGANPNASRPDLAGFPAPFAIIRPFSGNPMEAERVNAISNHLADLSQRETELRRYL